MPASARHVVGIDLGTTHCVVAWAPVGVTRVEVLPVPQLVAPGEVAARPLLPSFAYLPAPGELVPAELALPWGASGGAVVGELARQLGARSPQRLVTSAKSWICHGGVNRRAPVLPWSAPDGEPHLSPYQASVDYLAHLRAAWDAANPGAPLAAQDVTVTVPASFDDDARELTLAAARDAGLGEARLLEEPQAAFYDFLGEHPRDLGAVLGDARLVLVVDVGGGTTDLTLLRVRHGEAGSAPVLERIAVGGHLLLGGDNMDAALAHHVREKGGLGDRLDPARWSALVQSARAAKERLLATDAPTQAVVTALDRGSRLVGGTHSVVVTRDEAARVVLDGFVPFTGPADTATRTGRAGLTTLGLPYVTDPAIPRHVCAFLRRHAGAAAAAGARVIDGLPRPDRLLVNGGVFNAPSMVERLSAVLAGWYGGEAVPLLRHTSLDAAVARGAARAGLARLGVGAVIGGGSARAYYVGVEGPAGERRAVCAAPRGLGDGATVVVPGRVFELVLDRPVVFPLYSCSGDRVDVPGDVVDVDAELEPLPQLETVLRDRAAAGAVPVTLSATLAESGALELSLVSVALPPRRWRLALALSGVAGQGAPGPAAVGRPTAGAGAAREGGMTGGLAEACRRIGRALGEATPDPAKALRGDLEARLGPRGQWAASVCRALADALLVAAPGRRRTALHELHWLRLAGWCLRPGAGADGDERRVSTAWALHDAGLAHPSKAAWPEWWVFWRRLAAGLDRRAQETLFYDVSPWLSPAANAPPGPRAQGVVEMLQLTAALERLPREHKEHAGEWFLARADKLGSWWPLGRLGAREPLHGDARDVVPRATAESWLLRVLALDWAKADGAALAATLLARMTGDPARDVDSNLRERVLERLRGVRAQASFVDLVTRPTALSAGDAGRVLGDALPAGLRLR